MALKANDAGTASFQDAVPAPTARRRFSFTTGLLVATVALVAYLVLVPLVLMITASFSDLSPRGGLQSFTLDNYRAFLSADTYRLLGNTAMFTAGTLAIAIPVGTGLAWLVERTNVGLRTLAYVLIPIVSVIPGVMVGMAWALILGPRVGVANALVTSLFGGDDGPFNAYSMAGMVSVEGLRTSSAVFLMMVGFFRGMDPALEDSAALSGAKPSITLRRITLPLATPALLGISAFLVMALIGTFEIPAILGLPGGVEVFSTRIYLATSSTPTNFGLASSLSSVMIVVAVVGVWMYHRRLADQSHFATVTGKGFRPRRIDLGRMRVVGTAAIVCYALLAVVLPVGVLIWTSLLPFYAPPSAAAFSRLTLDGYRTLVGQGDFIEAMQNTLLMVAVVPTVAIALSVVLSWLIVRSRIAKRKRRSLDLLALLPHAMPGIVLGFAFLWLYLTLSGIPIYGTIWLVCLALITSFLAFGTRMTNGAMYQLKLELEEAASVSGAPWFYAMRKVVVPLLLPSIVGAWVFVALYTVRDLPIPLILYSGKSRPMAVLLWDYWQNASLQRAAAMGVAFVVLAVVFLSAGRVVISVRTRRQRRKLPSTDTLALEEEASYEIR